MHKEGWQTDTKEKLCCMEVQGEYKKLSSPVSCSLFCIHRNIILTVCSGILSSETRPRKWLSFL